jgi:predicted anti-sigma-YlaC factor YlaD
VKSNSYVRKCQKSIKEKNMNTLKAWWPSIVAGAVALWGVFGTRIQGAVALHPTATLVLGGIGVIIAHLLPSPVTPTVPKS